MDDLHAADPGCRPRVLVHSPRGVDELRTDRLGDRPVWLETVDGGVGRPGPPRLDCVTHPRNDYVLCRMVEVLIHHTMTESSVS
jgi:hypothetical protein